MFSGVEGQVRCSLFPSRFFNYFQHPIPNTLPLKPRLDGKLTESCHSRSAV